MKYYKFAQKNCSNYQQTVMFNKDCVRTNYCWISGSKCLLNPEIDKGCLWFVNAVLHLNKELEAQWLAENPISFSSQPYETTKTSPKPGKPKGYRICDCGREYPITSNRQKSCPECSRDQARKTTSARQRKYRTKQGSA